MRWQFAVTCVGNWVSEFRRDCSSVSLSDDRLSSNCAGLFRWVGSESFYAQVLKFCYLARPASALLRREHSDGSHVLVDLKYETCSKDCGVEFEGLSRIDACAPQVRVRLSLSAWPQPAILAMRLSEKDTCDLSGCRRDLESQVRRDFEIQ